MKYETKAWEEKMTKSVASYESNLSSIRASQANPAVVSGVSFEYYGAPTKIVDMANVSLEDAKTLKIVPYDAKTLKDMVKAIQASDIGINPQDDGMCIRLKFPPLTEEHRKELSKQISKMGEEAKVVLRNIRRDANDDIKKQKKDGILTEDDQKTAEKNVQDLTDKYIKKVEEITAKKSADIMKI